MSVVSCHLEVSASDWSLLQRGPIECGVSECDRESSVMRRLWPTRDCCTMKRRVTKPGRSTQRLYVTADTLPWCY